MRVWHRSRRPLLLAHRGACVDAPENTLAAFQLALDQGADGVELDVKLSADGEIVVIHDATVDRTTNGNGQVGKLSLQSLRSLDAGCNFSPSFRGERIPTLDEVFEIIGKRGIIDIEITNYHSPFDDLPQRIMRKVRQHQVEDWVFYSSFCPLNIYQVRQGMPAVPAGLVSFPGRIGALQRSGWLRRCAPDLVIPNQADVDETYIEQEHRHGRKVIVWTVNDPSDLSRLIGWGVDGIITDEPMKMRETMNGGEAA